MNLIKAINQDTRLEDITSSVITNLLTQNLGENLYWDFKTIPKKGDPKYEKSKYNLRKAIASFANTFGGFIFFGIHDEKNSEQLKDMDRIVGIEEPTELGQKLSLMCLSKGLCIPIIAFEGPRIIKINKKNVAVIKILHTANSPHAIKDKEDCCIEFWVRNSQTALPMNYTELTLKLDKNREQRGWLHALYLDIKSINTITSVNIRNADAEDSPPDEYDSIVTNNWADLIRSLGTDPRLIALLFTLKMRLRNADKLAYSLLHRAPLGANSVECKLIRGINQEAAKRAKQIQQTTSELTKYLIDNYESIRELHDLHNSTNI